MSDGHITSALRHLLQEKHTNEIQGQAHPSAQSVYWYRGDLQQPNQDADENI